MKRALLALALTACGHGDAPSETIAVEPSADAIARTTENGPVKATVRVWPAKPSLGDPLYVRLTIEAPPGITVDAPFQEAGDQTLGRFHIVGFTRDNHRNGDGGQVEEQTYSLEAQASGKHRVPPLRLEMVDARGSATKPQEILTDEIPLDIAPVKSESVNAELKAARGELDPDVGGVPWIWVVGAAGLAAMAISGGILIFRSVRGRRRIALQRSAYDEAVSRLHALEKRGAPTELDADTWFVELSTIVRRYLEQRYVIRAPELTTEEFLQVMSVHPELTTLHRALLGEFLQRCDRVKFAGYRPDAKESLATLETARGFVEDTRLKEPKAA